MHLVLEKNYNGVESDMHHDCKEPKACTIMVREASRYVLNEVERNLHVSGGG